MWVVWPIPLLSSDLRYADTPVLGSAPPWDPGVTYHAGDRVTTPDGAMWEAPFTSYRLLSGATQTNLDRDPVLGVSGFLVPYGTRFLPRTYLRPNVTATHLWWTPVQVEDASALNAYFWLSPPLYRKTRQASPLTVTVVPRYGADALALFALEADTVRVNGDTRTKPAHLNHLLFADVTFPAEIELTGTGEVACGYLCAGELSQVGVSDYGTELGFKDYSHKPRQFDGDGSIDIIERDYSDTANFKVRTPSPRLDQTVRFLAQLRATPAAYIAHLNLPETLTFGYYQDFSIPIADTLDSELSLSVEGLV